MSRGLIAFTLFALCSVCGESLTMSASVKDADSIRVRERAVRIDSVPEADKSSRYEKLTDADFRMVAEELGVASEKRNCTGPKDAIGRTRASTA